MNCGFLTLITWLLRAVAAAAAWTRWFAAQKGRDLNNIADLGGRFGVADLVDVGGHGQSGVATHTVENHQTFFETRSAKTLEARPVGLVETGLEYDRHVKLLRNLGQTVRNALDQVFVFDDARTGDEDKGIPRSARDRPDANRVYSATLCAAGFSDTGLF